MLKIGFLHQSKKAYLMLLFALVLTTCGVSCIAEGLDSDEMARIPPYLWSMCKGQTEDEVILAVATNKSFDLLSVNVNSRDICLLTETDNIDEVSPEYRAAENKLFFLQSDVDVNESTVAIWSMDNKPIKKELLSLPYQVVDSVIVYDKDKFYFSGIRKGGLASEKEIYRCTFHDGEKSIERLTRNNEIEGLAMYVPAHNSIYWYKQGKGDTNLIMKSTIDFKDAKIVGEGYLIDYSSELKCFLKFGGGLGRFATLELWNPETNFTKTIASDDQKHFYDASFIRKGTEVVILSGDAGSYNVQVDRLRIDNSDQPPAEVLRLDYSEKRWIPNIGGKQVEYKSCK